jgi:hypothetical protein
MMTDKPNHDPEYDAYLDDPDDDATDWGFGDDPDSDTEATDEPDEEG